MPFARISVPIGKSSEQKTAIFEGIQQAPIDSMSIPVDDYFQILSEHKPEEFFYDRNYLGINRSDDIVIIQITLRRGRSDAMKRELYGKIAQNLKDNAQVRPEDVFIFLTENDFSDWSVGNGEASMALSLGRSEQS
jgi:phenylpyruvate tautomerase PptA (4-oxalocrotonate tautomerase family)